ncbi:magnesium/cobalt transporter CorA [Gorillibacterium sp. sgz5001074]|uniref:magnesium/cobalt transporter CorA n=1 Tax=Gorillibacterium sp. sgz5001074 TaxID=3446695 RepID=UPI003F669AEE
MLVYHSGDGSITQTATRKPADQEVAWIRLKQPTPSEVKEVLEGVFGCHPLLVEDAVKLNQRPKLDRYRTHIFLTLFAVESKDLKLQEIGIVLGPNYVITISQDEIPIFHELEDEFQRKGDMMDHSGEILYHIVDRCVDEYSRVVEFYEDQVERIERLVYRNPYIRVAPDIFRYKRRLHHLRKVFLDEKTMLGAMSHQQLPYISQDKDVYFIDVYDHISRVIDSIDMFRESLSGLLELQMAMKSDRMNEIMKTLTLISSLFLPLTFIVGLYGMNFRRIPELDWSFGYGYVWLLMIAVSGGMFWFFKRKKWM